MTTRRLGFLFALGSYLMYSLNTPIARQAFLDGMRPETLLAYRFTAGAILFLLTITFTPLAQAKEGEKEMDRFGIWMGLGSGLLNGTAVYFFFNSLNLLPASFTAVLGIGIYIVVVILLLTLFGEKFTVVHAIRLVLGLTGVWLLVGPSGDLRSVGVLWLATGSTCFALHMISIQWYLREYNTWAISTLIVCATAGLLLILWLISGLRSGQLDFAIPSAASWLAVILLALFASWLGRVLSYRALSILGSGELALLTPTETLLAILWSVLFLGEWLEPAQWLGALLIILGVGFVGLKWIYDRRSRGAAVPAN